jgi:carbonic anhydrase/acetyltransferase-like protein (isoleucine patch superfamily)
VETPGLGAAAGAGTAGKIGAMIIPYKNISPRIDPTVYIAPSADVVGDVVIGKDSSVWFQTVIRGDVNTIRIGERTNIQDGCLLHVRNELFGLEIGSAVTLGHGVIAHGCRIRDHVLIGMGAIILDNAEINSYTLVAAGSVVKNDMRVPSGVLVAGVPAKIVR